MVRHAPRRRAALLLLLLLLLANLSTAAVSSLNRSNIDSLFSAFEDESLDLATWERPSCRALYGRPAGEDLVVTKECWDQYPVLKLKDFQRGAIRLVHRQAAATSAHSSPSRAAPFAVKDTPRMTPLLTDAIRHWPTPRSARGTAKEFFAALRQGKSVAPPSDRCLTYGRSIRTTTNGSLSSSSLSSTERADAGAFFEWHDMRGVERAAAPLTAPGRMASHPRLFGSTYVVLDEARRAVYVSNLKAGSTTLSKLVLEGNLSSGKKKEKKLGMSMKGEKGGCDVVMGPLGRLENPSAAAASSSTSRDDILKRKRCPIILRDCEQLLDFDGGGILRRIARGVCGDNDEGESCVLSCAGETGATVGGKFAGQLHTRDLPDALLDSFLVFAFVRDPFTRSVCQIIGCFPSYSS